MPAVPRLQRKHYELIPKTLSELDFFVSFFSHLTVIIDTNSAGAFDVVGLPEGAWKGADPSAELANNTFAEAWGRMSETTSQQEP